MSKIVAISVTSKDGLNSAMDPRFGRAFAFIIVDADTRGVILELENGSASAAQGAGTSAASAMSNNNVDAVISGRYGPKAAKALDSFGIEMWMAPDGLTAAQALEEWIKGNLTRFKGSGGMPSGGSIGGGGGSGGGTGGGGGGGGTGGGGSGMGGGGRGRGMGGGGMGGGGRGRGMGGGGCGGGKGRGRVS